MTQEQKNEMSTNTDDVQVGKRKAEAYLNSLESEVTKFMDNQQLKRCLILKQIKLVDLQINKLQNTAVTLGDPTVINLIDGFFEEDKYSVEETEICQGNEKCEETED